MKTIITGTILAAVAMAAAAVYSHSPRHSAEVNRATPIAAVLDCCGDPPPCGVPGEPPCFPPIPPATASN